MYELQLQLQLQLLVLKEKKTITTHASQILKKSIINKTELI